MIGGFKIMPNRDISPERQAKINQLADQLTEACPGDVIIIDTDLKWTDVTDAVRWATQYRPFINPNKRQNTSYALQADGIYNAKD